MRVLWRREDVVRRGPKRPPLGIALRPDGSGIVRVGRAPGSSDLSALTARIEVLAPGLQVEEVDVVGPPVADDLRGAGWAEVLAALHVLESLTSDPTGEGAGADIRVPGGGRAAAHLRLDDGGRGRLEVDLWAGEALCPVTLRSYALGAVCIRLSDWSGARGSRSTTAANRST